MAIKYVSKHLCDVTVRTMWPRRVIVVQAERAPHGENILSVSLDSKWRRELCVPDAILRPT